MDLLTPGIVEAGRDNGTQLSFYEKLKGASKTALGALLNGPAVTTTSVLGSGVAAGVAKAGEGVKAAGQGVKASLTSASSGIKWGIAILVVLVVLFVAAPYVGLLRRN